MRGLDGEGALTMTRSQRVNAAANVQHTESEQPPDASVALEVEGPESFTWSSAPLLPDEVPSSGLDPSAVLRWLAEISVEATDAWCGGIMLAGSEAWAHKVLTHEVTSGDSELPRGLGSVPAGRGALGHPDGGYLRIPVEVDGDELASVILVNRDAQFSAEHEKVVRSLAGGAERDIANARMFDALASRERWSTALNQLTGRLLRREHIDARHLQMFVDCACELGGADLVYFAIVGEDQASFNVVQASGVLADRINARHYRLDGTLAQTAIQTQQTSLFSRSAVFADLGPEAQTRIGSVLVAPFRSGCENTGTLVLARDRGREPFVERHLEMAEAFADHLGSFVVRQRLGSDQETAIIEDRARIGRDLHDRVIQHLFDIAVGLQATATTTSDPAATARITQRVGELDEAIIAIRDTVFAITGSEDPGLASLRKRVLRIVDEMDRSLPMCPEVTFVGPVDDVATRQVADDVCAVIAQGIANAAGHVEASRVGLIVSAAKGRLVVELDDDGYGPDPAVQSNALINLQARAAAHRGEFLIERNDSGGTTLTWAVLT